VLAVFSRRKLPDDVNDWLRIFANHAAVAIGNARAFEEIEFLKQRLEEEVSYLREEVSEVRGVGNLVGESPALRKVQQQIDLVAPTQATVLITGESGTGKELVARAIHERSPRHERPMITVNCSAIPEALFESEFFGHARGAFTGAQRDKPGRFELANGGTLFLDEIGELPLPMQAKLLRVLQEQEVERVGEIRARKINVRVVAATNRNLAAEVEAGRFRQDLFYRLSVFPIENPPLRERREDIPRLAEHFIRTAAKRMNRKPPKFTNAAARQLSARDWPGNVRELQNAVERAVILSRGNPLVFDETSVPPKVQASALGQGASMLTRSELKERERESLVAALAQTRGKIFGPDGAAALLGMKPTTLASRIKVLGIQRK
jgi:transcriptional regulator with GAF, ATPase, and Fis domain